MLVANGIGSVVVNEESLAEKNGRLIQNNAMPMRADESRWVGRKERETERIEERGY